MKLNREFWNEAEEIEPLGIASNDIYGNPLAPILDLSSAFTFRNSDALQEVHADKFQKHRYGRDSGIGALQLERELEGWHPGFRALSFRSGMAALEVLFQMAWANFDSLAIQSEVYRKTESLISALQALAPRQISRLDIHSQRPDNNWDCSKPSFIFVELPSNPHLRVVDTKELVSLSASRGKPFLAVDATMTGLGNLRPKFLESVDVLCYSLTKFIGGHNDLIGGILFVKDEIYEQAWALRSRMGNIIGPMEAFLAMRSLKTFAIRMEGHLKSTEVVLGFMQEKTQQRSLRGYFYPGFGQNLDQEYLVREVLFHRGSVLSFIPNRTRDEIALRIRELKFIKLAPSFGSTDSLFEICSLMTRPDATDRELLDSGLEPNLVRLSIGIDKPDLIIDDLEKILR